MIKVVATDLDGTLLRSDSTLSPRTRKALRTVRDKGIKVVAATARPARVIEPLFGGHDLLDEAICGNGAVLYDLVAKEISIRHPLPNELARRVIHEIAERIEGAAFAVETGRRVLFEPAYTFRPSLDYDRFPVAGTEELLQETLVKIMVQLPDEDPDLAWAILRPTLEEHIACTWSAERAPLEIALAGVDKAQALRELCADWGVSAGEVMAFGDAPNDLPMLAWAGTAYAVANAHPAVRAATRNHTAGNDDDGVAQVLEQAAFDEVRG